MKLFVFALWLGSSGVDLASTDYAIGRSLDANGAARVREQNPALESRGARYALTLGAAVGMPMLLTHDATWTHHKRLALWLSIAAASAHGIAAAHNMRVAARYAR